MRSPSQTQLLTPRSWLRLPTRTARLRLTLLYGGLILASGALVVIITYLSKDAIDQEDRGGSPYLGGEPFLRPSGQAQAAHLAIDRAVALQRATELHHLLISSGIALALVAMLAFLLSWYVGGRVLRPVRTMAISARRISANTLYERLALRGPDDEFKALGDTLDDLLARLQTAFEAQQHFIANASHELRTPLAWEQMLLQVALADPNATNAALRETCKKVLTANKRQQGLVEALLTLATSEGGLDHHEPIDLSVLADAVLLALRPEADRRHVEITAAIEPAPTSGHPALVERLITNLIDNAVRHNIPGGRIHFQTTIADHRAVLLVSNTGPEILSAEIQRLFEPFQRLKTAPTNGHGGYGLGLSIVQAIAAAHRARLTADPRPGGGLSVQVRFPLATTVHPGVESPDPRK